MASAKEVYNELGSLQRTIETCIRRCDAAPFPSFDREKRISSARQELSDILRRAGTIYENITKETKSPALAINAEIAATQAELSRTQNELHLTQEAFNSKRSELQRRRSASNNDQEKKEFLAQAQKLTNEFEPQHLATSAEASRLQSLVTQLQREQKALNTKLEIAAEELLAKECPEDLAKVVDEAKALVDKVGLLEKEIGAGANAALVQEAKAGFATNAKSFKAAESFHRSQARRLFWAMLLVAASTCILIYYLFVSATPTNPKPEPGVPQALLIIEHIVLIATGRVALLIVAGYALKYLATLHKMHAEQSVIYRDRLAALGIAENLLNATPEIEQRRDMLKSLANVYLSFDESAFGRYRKDTERAEAQGGVENQIRRIKMLTSAVAPLLEPATKAIDKAKEGSK
ncbi:hypothetical protein WMF27_39375 [Sorangium sp. So ce281]|uniref:hypothetical protein n=1 Tax=unclassified Sorangium TaxID=2621164 RepID=UPI003F6362C7